MMPAPISDILHDALRALETGDWDAVQSHPGLYETLQHFPAMLAAFPDMRHDVQQEFVSGNTISTVIIITATHLGPFLGIAPTGKQIQFMLLGIDTIEDGKIVKHYALPDFMAIVQQLGATITPPTPVTVS